MAKRVSVTPVNGHDEVMPVHASRFGEVADLLRKGDPSKGFNRAAEILLENFEAFAKTMQPYVVLKLALETHKHALFCEVAQDKARTQHDTQAYAAYQQYLAGNTDIPVAIGIPNASAPKPGVELDVDTDLGEETADGGEE